MAWIESHEHLEKNGRLLKLADILGINIYQAIGHLHAFWWWSLHNAGRIGDLSQYDAETISKAAGWDRFVNERVMDHERGAGGYPETYAFCHALVTVGFIDVRKHMPDNSNEALGEGASIHQWEKYSKRYFDWHESIEKRRESERIRQRERRDRVRKMSRTDNRDSWRPNQTKPNQTNNTYRGGSNLRLNEPALRGIEVPDDLKASEPEIRDWLEYKAQKGQKYKPKGLEALWRSFRSVAVDVRREMVDYSMANNWAGLFPDKFKKQTQEVKSWQEKDWEDIQKKLQSKKN